MIASLSMKVNFVESVLVLVLFTLTFSNLINDDTIDLTKVSIVAGKTKDLSSKLLVM